MATASSSRLLKLALPLVPAYGFTREALARSVLSLPVSETRSPHASPLSDSAVTALFGSGDRARRTLIYAWLQDGLEHMAAVSSTRVSSATSTVQAQAGSAPDPALLPPKMTVRDALRARLAYNESVLAHLPDAYALLASSSLIHIVDPLPALSHATSVAHRACIVADEQNLQLEWYTRRASLAAVYAAAELHQLTSPHTAPAFLDSLLASSAGLRDMAGEVGLYADYVLKSWKGIIKSSGAFMV